MSNIGMSVLMVLLLSSVGCTITLPEPVWEGQVRSSFKDVAPSEPSVQAALEAEATTCASRLNRHRDAAATFNGVRVGVTAAGALTSGVSGVYAVATDEQQDKTTAGIIAAVGAGTALVGTFLVSLVGDSSERLDRHARARASWDLARAKALEARLVPDAQRMSLVRVAVENLRSCQEDRAPAGDEVGVKVGRIVE